MMLWYQLDTGTSDSVHDDLFFFAEITVAARQDATETDSCSLELTMVVLEVVE
jgi:hypothetical protein